MIERVHRQLKAALMARENCTNWMVHLPLVLLGIRTAWRNELDCSPAELTFGMALHLPGEAVVPSGADFSEHGVLRDLHKQMANLQPTGSTDHTGKETCFHVPPTLENAMHVFIWRDARAAPLTRPYQGPFKVVSTGEKVFEIDIHGKIDKISIDRLKKAYVDQYYDSKSTEQSQENSEELPAQIAQPLKKRGRPSKETLREREREARAEAEERETREREDAYNEEFPPLHATRSGRISRPPSRL